MSRNKWTEEEDQILKDNYNILTDDKLVELLPNRTRSSVYARRKTLGLNKSVHKLSFKDVIEEINKRGYILLSDEADYRDVHSKMRYICPKHKDKGEQRIDLGHLRSGRGCYYCGRERTIESRLVDIDKENDRKIVENKGIIYVNSYRKDGKMYIDYICPKHYEIGTQTMNRNYMLKHAVGCAYCHGHSLPEWYIRKKISEINPDIELLESYENMTKRIKCRCKKHNHISTKSVQEILMGRGCKYCGAQKISEQHYLTDEEVQLRVSKKHPHIKLIKYEGIHSNMSEWLCTKHNRLFKKVLSTMLRSEESGCSECYKERMKRDFSMSTNEFQNKLKESHPELIVVGEYSGMASPIQIYCSVHDYTFQTTPANILHRTSCCPKSFVTYKEETMCSLIESWGYIIERQYEINGCKDKKPLKFDCFLTDYNTVVEYDGENHYYPIRFGTQSIEDAIQKHEYTKKHDKIKNDFCIKNKINIIRVPYFEFENMDFYLFDKFVELGIIEENKVS